MKYFLLLLLMLSPVAFYNVVEAQNPPLDSSNPNPPIDEGPPNPNSNPNGTNNNGTGGSVTINNPLGDTTLMGFFRSILEILLVFAVPLIVFFIIFAGFKYVMAQGKPEEIKTASRALLYAIIGGLIILGAWIILAVIEGTVAAFIT